MTTKRMADESSNGQPDDASSSRQRLRTSGVAKIPSQLAHVLDSDRDQHDDLTAKGHYLTRSGYPIHDPDATAGLCRTSTRTPAAVTSSRLAWVLMPG